MSVSNGQTPLKDLQEILRKTIGDELTVVNYETLPLVAPGENYGSLLLKVDAIIKRTTNSIHEEDLYLVAKIITASMKKNLKMDVSFRKEIFVFDKLVPAYRELENKYLSKNLNELFPKFYGGRLTLDEESPDEAVLLLENLKVIGFETMNRKKGLDLEHAKLALMELARFHGLGIALKTHKPALFEEARECMKEMPFDSLSMDHKAITVHLLTTIFQDPRIAEHQNCILRAMPKNLEDVLGVHGVEPWMTVAHGDFWVNNIMFRTEVKEVKFIDFQLSSTCSPLKDLCYFLCASTSQDVLDNHVDDLLDLYYDRFVQAVDQLQCDPSPFTKKNFEEELSQVAKRDMFYCLMALKFFTVEMSPDLVNSDDPLISVLMSSGNQLFLDRAWMMVSKFIEKGWL